MASASVWPAAIAGIRKMAIAAFKPNEDDHNFDPKDRATIVRALWERHASPFSPPDQILNAFSLQLAAWADGKDLVIGIVKKGMSLLMEVNVDLKLANVHSDEECPATIPAGNKVLVVDDSIHNGVVLPDKLNLLRTKGATQFEAFVLLASEDGLAVVQRKEPSVKVDALFRVPEQLFGSFFQTVLVPAMEHYRVGAISNRRWRVVRVGAPRYVPAKVAQDTLEILSKLALTEVFEEIPPFFGSYPPVFRGTIYPAETLWSAVERTVTGQASLDQIKLRVFIDPGGDELRLQIYGIVWLLVKPELGHRKLELEAKAVEALLSAAAADIAAAFAAQGYSVKSSA